MNISRIDWTEVTFNPLTGCLFGCNFCYAEKIANRFAIKDYQCNNCCQCPDCAGKDKGECPVGRWYIQRDTKHILEFPSYTFYPKKKFEPYPFRFEPTFHRYRLDEPSKIKKPKHIFVCSMAELFGDWVPDEWIKEVFKACEEAPQHKYMFLTKNPKRYWQINGWNHRYDWSFTNNNWWFGITITSQKDTQKLKYLPYGKVNTFISIEPIQEAIDIRFYIPEVTTVCRCSYCGHYSQYLSHKCQHCGSEGGYSGSFRKKPINWVIIGAETGTGAKPPNPEWVQSIIDQCNEAKVPVFLKDNLNWPEDKKEYPW